MISACEGFVCVFIMSEIEFLVNKAEVTILTTNEASIASGPVHTEATGTARWDESHEDVALKQTDE